MNDAVITLNGLEKRFPGMDKPAVAPLDCTIHAGYVTGLVGPDGAGKTTLMRMLAGLLKPDSGSATVIGFDPIKNDAADGDGEPQSVRGFAQRHRRGTEANFCSPAGVYVSWPVYRTPGGQALRWDETKTWPGLYPGGRTESVAAR